MWLWFGSILSEIGNSGMHASCDACRQYVIYNNEILCV